MSARKAWTVARAGWPGISRSAQCAGDLRRDLGRVAERCKLREPGAVDEAVGHPTGHFEHQACLAGPTGSDQRDKPVTGDKRLQIGQLAFSPDERGQLDGEVRPPGAERAERRELPRQVGHRDLEDLLGPIEVPKAVRPEVPELGSARQAVPGQDACHRRDQDLATVTDGEDAGRAVERRSEVVAVADLGGPRVDRHPDPELPDLAPVRVAQGALGIERGRDRGDGLREHREEAVAGRLDHGSVVALDGGPQQGIVERQRAGHLRGPLLPETGAPLDVRDQEAGDGRTRWRRRHGGGAGPRDGR